MTRLPAIASALVAASTLVGLGHGCTAILDIPEEVTGYYWCLDAEPAKGRRADNLGLIDIRYAVSDNWTRGCKCYCAADHQIMLQGAAGKLAPGSEDALWYDLQVGQLRASAATECNDRAAELEAEKATIINFDDPDTVSCLDAVADESPYFASECVQFEDTCPPGAEGGFGTDGYIPGTGGTNDTTDADGTQADVTATTDGGDIPDTGEATTVEGSSDGGDSSDATTTGGVGVDGIDELRTRPARRRE